MVTTDDANELKLASLTHFASLLSDKQTDYYTVNKVDAHPLDVWETRFLQCNGYLDFDTLSCSVATHKVYFGLPLPFAALISWIITKNCFHGRKVISLQRKLLNTTFTKKFISLSHIWLHASCALVHCPVNFNMIHHL